MALTIIFFILTMLKVNIEGTAVFLSNVHEMTTPAAISDTFGIDDDSVPENQLIPITLAGARRRHQDNARIYLKINMDDTEINLILKPTVGYLATRYTPVWSAVTDEKAYNNIRYDPLPNAMEDIGAFKMYQDVDNQAAIVVYADPDHEAVIEGFVTLDYAIKSLPKRLWNQTLNVGDNHFIESPMRYKRSIDPDADEVTDYDKLFRNPPAAKNTRRNVYRHVEKLQHHYKRRRRNIPPETIYPEILLVLDHNAIRNHTITQALRYMLAFWNGVDMVYSTLDYPHVNLIIAGIIISADDRATPYIAEDTSIKFKGHALSILEDMGMHFGKERVRFPLNQFDIILAMTPINLCNGTADTCERLLGLSSLKAACTTEEQLRQNATIYGVGLVHYDWMYGGLDTGIHESAHIFGVDHDEGQGATADCHESDGYIMAATTEFPHQNLKWSPCSKRFFRDYFSSAESICLDNTPMWTKPVKEVLPGRWLTLDGQCRNRGFHKSCRISGTDVCMMKGCKYRNSRICRKSKHTPLPGTKCGVNKYCEIESRCVDE